MAKRNCDNYSSICFYPDYKRPKHLNPFDASAFETFEENKVFNKPTVSKSPYQFSTILKSFQSKSSAKDPDLKSVDYSALDAYQKLVDKLITKNNTVNNKEINQNYCSTPKPRKAFLTPTLNRLTPQSGVYSFKAVSKISNPPSQLANSLFFTNQIPSSSMNDQSMKKTKFIDRFSTNLDAVTTPVWEKIQKFHKFVKNLPDSVSKGKLSGSHNTREEIATPIRQLNNSHSLSLSSTISLSSTKSFNSALRSPHLLFTSTPASTHKAWREKKYLDESEARLAQIQELEREDRDRSMARRNRMIYTEEHRRLRLQLEGLILQRPETTKPDFSALSDEANELVDRVWNTRASQNEVFAKGNGAEIARKDLLTLSGLDWLNDEVINFYMWLICQRSVQNTDLPKAYAFTTFFYPNLAEKGYNSVRRWTRKVDIFSYDILIVPIHLTAHWCLAVVDLKNKFIKYYDSLLGNNSYCLKALQDYLEQEHMDKKKIQKSFTDFTLECRKDIPRQLNGSDCGMFSCKFAEYASRRAPINFDQTQMPYFRRRMVWEICQQKLL